MKIPSAHAVEGAIDEVETVEAGAAPPRGGPEDLITAAIRDFGSGETTEVALYDVGRPARPTRSVTAPSAVVAEATVLPTASQLAASDRSERTALPPMQIMRSLRRFSRTNRPKRHVSARRQQPGTPWWAWVAHGVLSVGAVYALSSLYHANFNSSVNALPTFPAAFPIIEPATRPTPRLDAVATNDEALDTLITTAPDERIWIRYERILLPNMRQQYAVVRVTQDRDGRVRVERSETSERPNGFPEDATLIDRRGMEPTPGPDAAADGASSAATQPVAE